MNTGHTVKRDVTLNCLLLALWALPSGNTRAEDTFDLSALELSSSQPHGIDLTRFSSYSGQVPGDYRVDIYVNGDWADTRVLRFIVGSNRTLQPEITPRYLGELGVNVKAIPSLRNYPEDESVENLPGLIEQAGVTFDFPQLRLDLTLPQAVMKRSARGSVDPALWDEGVPAWITGYQFTAGRTRQDDAADTSDTAFLNLYNGINWGAWRFRNNSTWIQTSGADESESSSRWDSVNTYIQRDLSAWKSQLVLGDSTSPSTIFDSVRFRGVQLMSNDSMLPDSQRNFAPTIRGVANSYSRVTVRQHQNVVYQAYVPPGPFVIDDLYSNTTNGDLEVTVTEADGREQRFVQPFSSVAIMQREGQMKYAMTAGQYRSSPTVDDPLFGQLSLIYGLPHDLTVYGGWQGSNEYTALLAGAGIGLGSLGSLSLDVTQSDATLINKEDHQGQSYRLQYSKSLVETGTTFSLAAYHYSTRGFYNLSDTYEYPDETSRRRSRLQVDLNQSLGDDMGSVYISGYRQDHWEDRNEESHVSIGYNNDWRMLYYSLVLTQTRGRCGDDEQQFSLNLMLPLGSEGKNTWAGYAITGNDTGESNQQLSLYGTAMRDNVLAYNITQGYASTGDAISGSASADYQGTYSKVSAGYSYTQAEKQATLGAQGSVIIHPEGITFGAPLNGDMSAVAIVQAPGVSGAQVQNTPVTTDWRGYAIMPYLNAYQKTQVSIDPLTLGDEQDIDITTQSVVPTTGAVVMARFVTRLGKRVLFTLLSDDKPVPFGATVTLEGDDNTGIVGDDGQLYLSGTPEEGRLNIVWGNGVKQQCTARFKLPKNDVNQAGIMALTIPCKAERTNQQ